MDRHTLLPESLKRADSLRKAGRWEEAIGSYMLAENSLPASAGTRHNIAVCFHALGDYANALKYAELAIEAHPGLWQSQLLKAKSLCRLGDKEQAMLLLEKLVRQYPSQPEPRLELAALALDEFGDAARARELVQPVANDARHAKNARLTELMAGLYDSWQSAEELSHGLCRFADRHLARPKPSPQARSGRTSGRRRVGLISPQFCCSPVYFFCIGALKHLAQEVDLLMLNRGRRDDWATGEFRRIAAECFDVAGKDSESLSAFIASLKLDALIDMGGWMDPIALSAISAKPAKRLYKWVGGQAATTGIAAFDGFFTDLHQSPPELQPLYAEPLAFLDSGYVTYTPPPYMPEIGAAARQPVFGVIANPAKISRDFLEQLKTSLEAYANTTEEPISLRLIDRRYQHARLRSRILSALEMDEGRGRERVAIDFVVPDGHRDFLEETGKLTAVIDTFPYSGGLTTMEALSLGVPCITKAGRLFSGRHSYSHCLYSGVDASLCAPEKNLSEMLHFYHQHSKGTEGRASLISSSSRRLDHQALATAIAGYL